jgi:hypothetical protein
MICRFCGAALTTTLVDLGMQPLSNAYIDPARAEAMEPFYPLHVRVCGECLLVQLPELASPEHIFTDYAYLSGVSSTWVEHCARFVDHMTSLLALGKSDLVIELASNDGTLLRGFVERGVAVLGIEPAANVAELARRRRTSRSCRRRRAARARRRSPPARCRAPSRRARRSRAAACRRC